jgi:hypothetical protein
MEEIQALPAMLDVLAAQRPDLVHFKNATPPRGGRGDATSQKRSPTHLALELSKVD